jgi:hypothetical protein
MVIEVQGEESCYVRIYIQITFVYAQLEEVLVLCHIIQLWHSYYAMWSCNCFAEPTRGLCGGMQLAQFLQLLLRSVQASLQLGVFGSQRLCMGVETPQKLAILSSEPLIFRCHVDVQALILHKRQSHDPRSVLH